MSHEIRAFVEEQAAKLTHQDIVKLASRLPALREQFSCIPVLEYPQLAEQYEFLALIVEDCSEHIACKVPEVCQREAAFALLYLEKHGDLLPDDAPGIGLTDDQAVVATVLHKHREALRACPRGYLFKWEAASVDFDRMILDRLHHRLHKFRAMSLFGGKGKAAVDPAVTPSPEQRRASLAERAQHTVSTGEDLGVQTTRLSVEADERETSRQHRSAADAVVRQGFIDAKADANANADDMSAASTQKPTPGGCKISMKTPPHSSSQTNPGHDGDSPSDGSPAAYVE